MKKSTARVTPIRSPKKAPEAEPLGPGLHAGQVERLNGRGWQVRLLDGRTIQASLGPAVVAALPHQCAADGRLVILAEAVSGPVILGALQTAPAIAPDAEGVLNVRVQRLNLEASGELVLRTPRASVELRTDGRVRLSSRRLVIDSPDNVRVRSALVELP